MDSKTIEWKKNKRWNPFNSYKLLAHVDTWRLIKRGKPVPPPILVTVDPSNKCNLDCEWCNAAVIRAKNGGLLSKKALLNIAEFLPKWHVDGCTVPPGVKAVCIAGGGEPLINSHVGDFIDALIENGIEVGVVTNGLLIDKFIDSLSKCTWVGVSIDAGSTETYHRYKGMHKDSNSLQTVLNNIKKLTRYALQHNNKLGFSHPAYGVSYKYLLYKDNIGEIYEATKLAKESGCKNIHFRPAGTTWDKIDSEKEIIFSPKEIEIFNEQITLAQELDDENFNVYGVTHKFNDQFARCNSFDACHAVFMTAVFSPPSNPEIIDGFNLGLCCDRRGDESLDLLQNCVNPFEINKEWGNLRHWAIHDDIDIKNECPRCTYQPHNEIYEQVILKDAMTYKFI